MHAALKFAFPLQAFRSLLEMTEYNEGKTGNLDNAD